MSVNYHAFQSRGYLFSNSEVVCEQWRTAFSNYDPARISRILNLESDDRYLYLTYFQKPYRLSLSDGILEKSLPEQEGWTDELYFNESMSIYHLLHYTKEFPRTSGIWVPNTRIDGVIARNPSAPDPLLEPFARRFSGRAGDLARICRALGGTALEKGDVSFQFSAFPQIPLQLVFWDADEDFPAQVQVLADSYVTDYVHYETVGCMVSDLLEAIESFPPNP